jgi:hypothetical protein
MVYAKWYLLLLDLKKWHRYAMTVLFLVIFFLFWLFLFYLPLYKQMTMIRMQLNQGKQDLQTNVLERELCKSLLQEIEGLEHAVKAVAFTSLNKTEENIGLIINQMESLAIRLLSVKKIGSVSKGQNRMTLVSLQAEGAFTSIVQFFTMLKDNQCLVQCSHFSLQHEKNDLYMLHAVLKFFSMQRSVQIESPSTLEKS